ncbi:MAG: nucleotidyltransferase [Armatimonadetes bacterium]|nr:nucleotidyltransferase [Armatimonadota bacterium]
MKHLEDNGVRYLIIGGYAYMEYAEPRYTKDLDLWIDHEESNAHRLYKALVAFGAPLQGLLPGDFTEEGYFYRMGVPPVMVDILFSIEGFSFEEAWNRRRESELNGVNLIFVAKDDLIAIKQATGRPQDLLDIQTLRQTVRSPDEFRQ